MKKRYPLSLLFALCLLPAVSDAQAILNGSFEDNIVLDDSLMLTEPGFDNTVANCYTIDGGFMDVISSATYCGGAHDGSFFIQNSASEYYGAFSMALDVPLVTGADYILTFWTRNCLGSDGSIVVGSTEYDSVVGTPIVTVDPASHSSWTYNIHYFTAMQPHGFIYVDLQNTSLSNQMQVDDFAVTGVLGSTPSHASAHVWAGPNPVTSFWNVSVEEPAELGWFNMEGKLILRQTLEAGANAVDRRNLAAGIYAYRITTSSGREASGRLVLQ